MADTSLRADEKQVEMQGDIRVAILTNGGRRLVHPSGFEIVQTAAEIAKYVAECQSMVEDAEADLAAAQAVSTKITAAIAVLE